MTTESASDERAWPVVVGLAIGAVLVGWWLLWPSGSDDPGAANACREFRQAADELGDGTTPIARAESLLDDVVRDARAAEDQRFHDAASELLAAARSGDFSGGEVRRMGTLCDSIGQ